MFGSELGVRLVADELTDRIARLREVRGQICSMTETTGRSRTSWLPVSSVVGPAWWTLEACEQWETGAYTLKNKEGGRSDPENRADTTQA